MMTGPLHIGLRWGLAVLVQAYVFHQLVLADGWLTPLFHMYALVLLPLRWRPLTYLLVGGVTGLCIDLLNLGGGLFTAAGLMSGLLQPWIARMLAPREGYEADDEPLARDLGWGWMVAHTFLIVWVHAFWLFAVEAGRWELFPRAVGQTTSSAALTTVLILAVATLFNRNGAKR